MREKAADIVRRLLSYWPLGLLAACFIGSPYWQPHLLATCFVGRLVKP